MQRFPKVGVGVIILNKHQHMLLGIRKNAHGNGSWGAPGLHIHKKSIALMAVLLPLNIASKHFL